MKYVNLTYQGLLYPFFQIWFWLLSNFRAVRQSKHKSHYFKAMQNLKSLRLSEAYIRCETNHHWFRLWLVAWLALSHYLNQWWDIVISKIWNKFQWNVKQNSYIFIPENVVWNMAAILSWPQWCLIGLWNSSRVSVSIECWQEIVHCLQRWVETMFSQPFTC